MIRISSQKEKNEQINYVAEKNTTESFSGNLQNDLNSVTDYGINELFHLCW